MLAFVGMFSTPSRCSIPSNFSAPRRHLDELTALVAVADGMTVRLSHLPYGMNWSAHFVDEAVMMVQRLRCEWIIG
jgi:hypothetical protein